MPERIDTKAVMQQLPVDPQKCGETGESHEWDGDKTLEEAGKAGLYCVTCGLDAATVVLLAEAHAALAQEIADREALEKDIPNAAEEEAGLAMVVALPDVLGAEILREHSVTIVATIKGEVYDDAEMTRLLDAEYAFLEARPGCLLSFLYIPAALAAKEKPCPSE